MSDARYAIGLDYGTNSVRALIVDVRDGAEIATFVHEYRRGEAGIITDPSNPHVARQDPADYVEGLEVCVIGALKAAAEEPHFCPERIIGIGVDTTGSTPLPLDREGTPLASLPQFAGNPNALAWLWKDHSSVDEAERITALAAAHRPQYLKKCGGTYSSEWFWSKIWHCLNTDPAVFDAAYTWVECCDYVPAVLVGDTHPEHIKHGVCAAGHKAMYACDHGGLPDAEFLALLDPKLADLRGRLYECAYDSSVVAGKLCLLWAEKLGLPAGIPVAVGAFDAHHGAVGAGVAEGTLVKIIGTSTCDITVTPPRETFPDVPGVCGIVDGSVLPGYFGVEAGQSAVGDIFNWFVSEVCEGDGSLHEELTQKAAQLKPGESGLLALDWNNGNRTILVDARLTGLLLGADAAHQPRGDLPGADRGHGLRGADHPEPDGGVRRPGGADRQLRRDRREERAAHADLRGRDQPDHGGLAQRPDLRAGGGDLRRRRRGCGGRRLRHHRAGPGRHDRRQGAQILPQPRRARGLREAVRPLQAPARRLRRQGHARRPERCDEGAVGY